MRTYRVYVPRRSRAAPSAVIADARAVKDGFSWPAFFFSFVWALWHRLWLVAVVVLALEGIVAVAIDMSGLDPVTEGAISLGLALIFGWIANDLVGHRREREGRTLAGIVLAPNAEEAVYRYFSETAPRDGFTPSSTRSYAGA